VQAGYFDFARVHGLQDAGHEAEADAVAEFGVAQARSRISRSMARPSAWRLEFQQVESEYMRLK